MSNGAFAADHGIIDELRRVLSFREFPFTIRAEEKGNDERTLYLPASGALEAPW